MQEINDQPPNPNQPVPDRVAAKPKVLSCPFVSSTNNVAIESNLKVRIGSI